MPEFLWNSAAVPAPQEVAEGIKSLATAIRTYYLERAAAWRRLPALMMEANGKSGHSIFHEEAYAAYRLLLLTENSYNILWLDLKTGHLLAQESTHYAVPFAKEEVPAHISKLVTAEAAAWLEQRHVGKSLAADKTLLTLASTYRMPFLDPDLIIAALETERSETKNPGRDTGYERHRPEWRERLADLGFPLADPLPDCLLST